MTLFVSLANFFSSIRHMNGVSLTFVLFELPLREDELLFGLLQVPFESGDLCCAGSSSKQHRLLIHIGTDC